MFFDLEWKKFLSIVSVPKRVSKKISLVGGSLRDIQMMAGHSLLQTTQRYTDGDSQSLYSCLFDLICVCLRIKLFQKVPN